MEQFSPILTGFFSPPERCRVRQGWCPQVAAAFSCKTLCL